MGSDTASNDGFGKAVSVSDNIASIGASATAPSGAIWNQTHKRTSISSDSHQGFGSSVSIFRNVIVIGSPGVVVTPKPALEGQMQDRNGRVR
mgnify:CR=1 FL=1|jgi:hypothetical protein